MMPAVYVVRVVQPLVSIPEGLLTYPYVYISVRVVMPTPRNPTPIPRQCFRRFRRILRGTLSSMLRQYACTLLALLHSIRMSLRFIAGRPLSLSPITLRSGDCGSRHLIVNNVSDVRVLDWLRHGLSQSAYGPFAQHATRC